MTQHARDTKQACPTCGHVKQPRRRTRSEFERNMDFWAARDAHNAMPVVVVLGIFLIWLATGYVVELGKRVLGY